LFFYSQGVQMNKETAETFLEFAQGIGPGLRGYDATSVRQQATEKYDEMKAAFKWFVSQGSTDESLRLASALVVFWMGSKRMDEGSAWLAEALALPGGQDAYRGQAVFDSGYLAFWKGDDETAASFFNRALEMGRQSSNPTIMAISLTGLARIALRTDIEEARRLCREALAVSEGTSDKIGRSHAMHVLAVASQMAGDFLEARELMQRRIHHAREEGNLYVVSAEAGNLSLVERQLGNLEEAEALVNEALTIDYRRGDQLAIAWKVNGVAAIAAERHEFDRAAILIGFADAGMEASGAGWPPDELVHYERTIELLTENLEEAELERLREAGRLMTTAEGVHFALQIQKA
jgi:tetratricopeptide (TPR) repeat protein